MKHFSKMLLTTLVAVMVMGALLGYAPVSRSSYIVQAADAQIAVRLVEAHGAEVTSTLAIIRGVGALLTTDQAAELAAHPETRVVTPNASVEIAIASESQAQQNGNSGFPATNYPDVVGADFVWSEGITGQGVTVAVIDAGLSLHTGLRMSINNQNNRIRAWVDFVEQSRNPVDKNGHGTHIAGIIANSQVGGDGEWNGVAPGVDLVGVRVLDKFGRGSYETVIQGIQWVVAHKETYNIRVMNLSLVSLVQSPYWADPLNQAVMQAWAEGIVVVAAAENMGPDAMSVGVPGNVPYVITVGAFTDNFTPNDWDDDYLAPFSAAGPTLDGFVKPDVVAPGAHMVSSMTPSSYLAKNNEASRVHGQYFSMAGTSQAAAVASAVAALILAQEPTLTPDQVKIRLMSTSLVWVDEESEMALYSMWQQSAGRIAAPDAVFAESTEAANFGMDIWGDLAGEMYYEGYSYYDEASGQFQLHGEFSDWAGGFGSWAGGYDNWTGGFGSWAGGFGSWAGGFGSWAGGFGSWAGYYGDAAFAARFVNWSEQDTSDAWTQSQTFINNVIEE